MTLHRKESPAARLLLLFIELYQATLSPFIGMHCRFHPTCSRYGAEAIRRFGAGKGCLLLLRRLARCHPLGGAGYDPVPRTPEDA
jgi:putative membrane protein insertion efficiency factor